jgi:hypothetical protein
MPRKRLQEPSYTKSGSADVNARHTPPFHDDTRKNVTPSGRAALKHEAMPPLPKNTAPLGTKFYQAGSYNTKHLNEGYVPLFATPQAES